MKQLIASLLFTLIVSNASAQVDTTKAVDTASYAKVYVLRYTGHVGSAVNFRLIVDDSIYCKIKNNRYSVFLVPPGSHTFFATTWDSRKVEKLGLNLTVEAGKTYYLSVKMRPRFLTNEIFVEEITYSTAAPLLEKYKFDGCD